MASTKALIPFALSLALHVGAGAGVWVEVRGKEAGRRVETPPDVWAGRGIELEESTEVTTEANASSPSAETRPSASDERATAVEPACVADCAPVSEGEAAREREEAARERDERREATARERDAAGESEMPENPAPTPRASAVRPSPRRAAPRTAATASAATATASASTAVTSASPASSVAPTSGAVGQAFGTAGLPPGVRYLPRAYTRAISQGGWGVAGFRSAARGRLCESRLSIAIAEDRSIGPVEYGGDSERDAVPPLCRTLFENARRLIVNGEFSLDAASLASGVMRLRITVEVSDGEPHEAADEGPNGLFSESHEPVSAGRRGRSSFTLNSGRRVDAFVELE